ncbi:conserved hypothetical protein [Paraburkholderia sabiae]|uniref:TniQ family protein n=1 Tax=Paraburkholderia sabiae TaxID=273251 RepID=UPI001CB21192|nr:TniQ family protein [Paraburkholderia sabiae]CAG9226007.1 conserved hypothetical protein [Paraburkholderia sabiae]
MTGLFPRRLPAGWPDDAPPRSTLFSLPLYGCCGEDRECLGSYVGKLSAAHSLARGTLTKRVIGPTAHSLFGVSIARMTKDIGNADYVTELSGLSDQARTWSDTLNHLTLRTNLQLGTLLPLRNLVSPYKLMCESKRYCPACYEADAKSGRRRYRRLLWLIDVVQACPIHNLRLVESSEARPAPHDEQTSTADFGEERTTAAATHKPATEYEMNAARLVAELLDDAVVFPTMGYSASGQSAYLTHAVDTLFDGMAMNLAAHLRVSKSQVHGWITGKIRMSLPRLVLTAYCCGSSVADILLGNRVMLSARPAPVCQSPWLTSAPRSSTRRTDDELKNELTGMVATGQARDATDASRMLGVSLKYFKKSFPAEHALLVQRGKESRRLGRSAINDRLDEAFLVEHKALCDARVYPSRRKVIARLRGKLQKKSSFRDIQRAQKRAHAITGVPLARGPAVPLVGPASSG